MAFLFVRKPDKDESSFEDHLRFAQLASRRFDLTEIIDDELADRFRRWTDAMVSENQEPIELVVNSPGGSVTAGFAIISQIRRLQRMGIAVIALVVGDAASMAAVIAAACDRCIMTSLSRLMWHGVQGTSRGDLSDIDDAKSEMERMSERLLDILTKRAKEGTEYADRELVGKWLKDKRPRWIYPEDALAADLCDEVVE